MCCLDFGSDKREMKWVVRLSKEGFLTTQKFIEPEETICFDSQEEAEAFVAELNNY